MKYHFYLLIFVLLISSSYQYTQAQPLALKNSFTTNNDVSFNINKTTDVDCGMLSPGCSRSADNGNYCIKWDVTCNQSSAKFIVHFRNPNLVAGMSLDWVWMYQDDNSGNWKFFNDNKNPTNSANHIGNIFSINSDNSNSGVIKFRVCITYAGASSSLASGNFNFDFGISVDSYQDL